MLYCYSLLYYIWKCWTVLSPLHKCCCYLVTFVEKNMHVVFPFSISVKELVRQFQEFLFCCFNLQSLNLLKIFADTKLVKWEAGSRVLQKVWLDSKWHFRHMTARYACKGKQIFILQAVLYVFSVQKIMKLQ